MHERKRMDITNLNTKLVIAGMTGLIDDGLTPHEVFEVLDDIKRNVWHGLIEIHSENKKRVKEESR